MHTPVSIRYTSICLLDQKGCTFSERSRHIGEIIGSVASFGCGLYITFSLLCYTRWHAYTV